MGDNIGRYDQYVDRGRVGWVVESGTGVEEEGISQFVHLTVRLAGVTRVSSLVGIY